MVIDENKTTFDTVEFDEYNTIASTVNDITDNGLPQKLFFTGSDHVGLVVNSLTTTERDLLTPENGDIIYNTTTNTFQFYENSTWRTFATGTGISAVVEDTTPQLGGDLDLNSHNITGNGDINISSGSTYIAKFTQTSSSNEFIQCINNSANGIFEISQDGGSNALTKMFLANGTTENIRLFTNGDSWFLNNLGIGTNSPSERLEINNTAVFTSEYDNGNSGASKTIDWGNGNFQKLTLDQNTTLSFTAPGAVGRFQLAVSGGASYTITWPTITWLTSGGTAPTLAGNDVITIVYDGTNYIGSHSNQA